MLDTQDRAGSARPGGSARPVQYVVRKDGKPFAILNATPALAARTLAGFKQANPAAAWSCERI